MQYLLHRLTLVLVLPLEHEALASGQPGKSNAVILMLVGKLLCHDALTALCVSGWATGRGLNCSYYESGWSTLRSSWNLRGRAACEAFAMVISHPLPISPGELSLDSF